MAFLAINPGPLASFAGSSVTPIAGGGHFLHLPLGSDPLAHFSGDTPLPPIPTGRSFLPIDRSGGGSTEATVPNVVGLTLSAASSALLAAGLLLGPLTQASSLTVPAGTVLTQALTAGTLVALGSEVALTQSSGYPLVMVPDVIGELTSMALPQLAALGFRFSVSTVYSETSVAGTVVSQGLSGLAVSGSTVPLVVSLGPPLVAELGAKYAALITSEHNQKPTYMALVHFLTDAMAEITNSVAAIPAAFDLDSAVGAQLDIIGRWVGRTRVVSNLIIPGFFGFADDSAALPFGKWGDPSIGGRFYDLSDVGAAAGSTSLNDDSYRTILHAAIVRNQSNGTLTALEAGLQDITGAPCSVADAGTLSLDITVSVPINATDQALITSLGLLPRPAGVAIGSVTYAP